MADGGVDLVISTAVVTEGIGVGTAEGKALGIGAIEAIGVEVGKGNGLSEGKGKGEKKEITSGTASKLVNIKFTGSN